MPENLPKVRVGGSNELYFVDSQREVLCPYGFIRAGEVVAAKSCSNLCAAFKIEAGCGKAGVAVEIVSCKAGNFKIGVIING